MKLIQQIYRRYLLFSILFLSVLDIAIFIALKLIVTDETDEKLQYTLQKVELSVKYGNHLASLEPFISVKETYYQPNSEKFSDTLLTVEEEEGEEFRKLTVIKSINNKTYKIVVMESVLESEDLIETISILIFLSFILLFGILSI